MNDTKHTSTETSNKTLLVDLANAKAIFQLRAITAAIGMTPHHEEEDYLCPFCGEHHCGDEVPFTCQTGDGV